MNEVLHCTIREVRGKVHVIFDCVEYVLKIRHTIQELQNSCM